MHNHHNGWLVYWLGFLDVKQILQHANDLYDRHDDGKSMSEKEPLSLHAITIL